MEKNLEIILLPIKPTLAENQAFLNHPDCQENLQMSIDFFNKIGYYPPFIGYYAQLNNQLVGACAVFKKNQDKPKVEIAYGTFPAFQQKGIANKMCQKLVSLAIETDPTLEIIAHTLPEENFSTKILRKNGFELFGPIWDEVDGNIWLWIYKKK
jgi:[ribosomal protein S5]-alanine N-acetyltransferase